MKTKMKKPLFVMAVTFLLIVLVFFISLNLGVIKIAPLKTLQVFFGQGTARDELVLFEFRLPGSSFPCSLGQESLLLEPFCKAYLKMIWLSLVFSELTPAALLLLCFLFTFFKDQLQTSAFSVHLCCRSVLWRVQS